MANPQLYPNGMFYGAVSVPDETLIGIDQLVLGTATSCDLRDLSGDVAIPTGTYITTKLINGLKENGIAGLLAGKPQPTTSTVVPKKPSIEIITSRIAEMRMRSGLESSLSQSTANQAAGTLTAVFKAVRHGGKPPVAALGKITELIIRDVLALESIPLPRLAHPSGTQISRLVRDAIDTATLTAWHLKKTLCVETDIYSATLGGLLHDIGMVFVPPHIFDKAGPLSANEVREIRRHPYLGLRALSPFTDFIPKAVSDAVLMHHERTDGTGYPLKRSGDNIPYEARLVHIVDAYVALVSPRPHRRPCTPHHAIEILLRDSGRSYDRKVLRDFINNIGKYPRGCAVILSTDEIGVVVGQGEGGLMKPLIDVYFSRQQQFSNTPIRVDLGKSPLDYIRQVLK